MTPYYTDEFVTLFHGDCRDVLPELPPADALMTDPPYGIQAGAAWVRTTGIHDDATEGHNLLVEGWRELVNLADDAVIVEFCGSLFDQEARTFEGHVAQGWTPWRRYLLVKQAPPPTPRKTMVSGWETSVISYKGTRRWYGGGYVVDRWVGLTPNRKNEAVHPTQKPIEPFYELIPALVPAGGLIVDPFAGSGTTLRAAKDLGWRAVGVEVNEEHCEAAARRLAQDVLFAPPSRPYAAQADDSPLLFEVTP